MAYRRRTSTRRRATRRSGRPTRRYSRRRMSRPSRRNVIPRSTQASPCVCPGELTPSHKFVFAQLDPFDPIAAGAKVPDSTSMPSIAHVDVDVQNLTSGSANQLAAWVFRPNYTAGTIVATPGTSVVWPTTADTAQLINRTKRTKYVEAMELTRPVAHAIRLTSAIAPTTATGFVHIGLATEAILGKLDGGSNNRYDYPTTVGQMSNLQHYKRVTLASLTQSPVTCINKWLDDTGFRYQATVARNALENPSTTGLPPAFIHTDYGWAAIIVMVESVPASAGVLSVEHLLMSEGIPDKDGVLIGTAAAVANPGAMAAANAVSTSTDPTHTEAEQESYISRGISAAAEGAAAAGKDAYEKIGLPLLQRGAYYMTGQAVSYGMAMIMGRGGLPGVNANPNRLAIN